MDAHVTCLMSGDKIWGHWVTLSLPALTLVVKTSHFALKKQNWPTCHVVLRKIGIQVSPYTLIVIFAKYCFARSIYFKTNALFMLQSLDSSPSGWTSLQLGDGIDVGK